MSAGEWSGSTSQGMPIAVSVSSEETLTTITVGYRFNGCSGSETFSDLQVATAPALTCIPGPCARVPASYRAFTYSETPTQNGVSTTVTGLFLPGGRAEGVVHFVDYAGCGSARSVEWSAARR
ncbi:MAG TPA: hypothetical protein VFV10_05785 [Gammaproteobacteria bacterium]|nr:hypothetical protein [Gammaproteobacteria bacterium]